MKPDRYAYRTTRVSAGKVTADINPRSLDEALATMASDGWRAISMFFDARQGHVPSLTIVWERRSEMTDASR